MGFSIWGDDSRMNPKLRPPPLLAVLFCLISTFCFIIYISAFHMSMMNMFFCFTLIVFYAAMGTGEGSAWERKYPSTTFLVPIGLFTALLPVYIGVKVYVRIYAPYYLAVEGRDYSDVPPVARTAEYADAGILHFTEDATLDTSRSFGYKADDFTYCVAPVVSRTASVHPSSSGPKVTFWAVGKDCCGSRSNFECDGAGETEVRSAFTVRDIAHNFMTKILVPRTSRPQYLRAIEAAKAIHSLRSEDDEKMILVRWAADPKDTLEVWHSRATVAVVVSCVVYSVFIIVVWSCIHVWYDRDIKRIVLMQGGKDLGGQRSGRQVKDPFMLGAGAP